MKTRIITAALLFFATVTALAAQEQEPQGDKQFGNSNFSDNTFYRLMGGSSIHKVLTEENPYYSYKPAIDLNLQGGKQFSKLSSIYLSAGIQRYERKTGQQPRILFGELDVMYAFDFTNLCFGYNPHRVVGFSLNAGGGVDVIRSFGEWSLGTNLRGGATIRLNFSDKWGIAIDPYCKYMIGQLARESANDTKVFEHGALIGVQYTVFDHKRRTYSKSPGNAGENKAGENKARENWDQTLEQPTGSAVDNSYFTFTAGTAFRIATKKRYNLSYDIGVTFGHRLNKLNALNFGILYESYRKKLYDDQDDITNPTVRQAELNLTHNINLTNAFYGDNPNRIIAFSTVEGIGFDILSDNHLHYGMNVHLGVEMDVRMSDHFSFIVSPMFKLWLGDVNFRDAGFDLASGGYFNAGLKYNILNPKNRAVKTSSREDEMMQMGMDATKYALQKKYNPNEKVKERVFVFDGWTIQLLGGVSFLNPDLKQFRPEGHGFIGMERRFGNFQWIQFGYGLGIASKKVDGLQLILNEFDANYRFSITNFINGIDNKKVVNYSVVFGTGLDLSHLENDGTNIGTHFLAGLDFGFRLNDSTRLILDPCFKLMTDNMDHAGSWRKFDTCYGLSVGIRVDLDAIK